MPIAAHATAASKDEARQFMAIFPDLVRDLTDAGRHLDIPEATKWFAKVLLIKSLFRIFFYIFGFRFYSTMYLVVRKTGAWPWSRRIRCWLIKI